jgi:anti-sigma-K factor RskA
MSARTNAAADYVLGLMEPLERIAFERELAGDPELAAEVEADRDRLHELDLTAHPEPFDDALWQRIEGALEPRRVSPPVQAAQRVARPAAPRGRGFWQSLLLWRAGTAAGVLASLVLLAVLGPMALSGAPQPVLVAVLVGEDGAGPGAIVEVSEAGVVQLLSLQDVPVPEGRALQVWTLPDADSGPVSVGLLGEAASLQLDTAGLPPPRSEQLFEITLEPESGSPTGRPTGPILFKGLTARTL